MPKRFTMRWADVPIVIDIPYAMTLLGLSRPTVLTLCQRGELPAKKFGSQWRISKEKLKAYIECEDGQQTQENNKTERNIK